MSKSKKVLFSEVSKLLKILLGSGHSHCWVPIVKKKAFTNSISVLSTRTKLGLNCHCCFSIVPN